MEVIFYNPIVNLFLFLYKFLGENFVISIIAVTLVLQLILWPLSIQQYKASKKMKGIQDKLKSVQDKRNAGKELSVAEMQMASQAFKGMAAGCLPSIIQLPFLIGLYDIITKVSHGDGTIFNKIAYSDALKFADGYKFNLNFLGLDLSKTIFTVDHGNILNMIVIVVLIAATIIAQYYQMKISTAVTTDDKKVQEIDATKNGKKKKKANKEVEIKDPLARDIAMSPQQTMKIFTIFISVLSITLPAALSIYWLARSIFVIILTKVQIKYIIKEK